MKIWKYIESECHLLLWPNGLELEASLINFVHVQMLLTFLGAKPGSPADAAIVIHNDLAIHMNIVSERPAFMSAARMLAHALHRKRKHQKS